MFATQGAPAKGLFDTYVKAPTGTNGFEFYLRALDIINDRSYTTYSTWTEESYAATLQEKEDIPKLPDYERPDPKEFEAKLKLAEHLGKLSYLSVEREMVQRYGDAILYVA